MAAYYSKKFTVDQFIQDFKNFYQNPGVIESGFKEELLRVESRVYKKQGLVLFYYICQVRNFSPMSISKMSKLAFFSEAK